MSKWDATGKIPLSDSTMAFDPVERRCTGGSWDYLLVSRPVTLVDRLTLNGANMLPDTRTRSTSSRMGTTYCRPDIPIQFTRSLRMMGLSFGGCTATVARGLISTWGT